MHDEEVLGKNHKALSTVDDSITCLGDLVLSNDYNFPQEDSESKSIQDNPPGDIAPASLDHQILGASPEPESSTPFPAIELKTPFFHDALTNSTCEAPLDDNSRNQSASLELSEAEKAEIWGLYKIHLRCALRSGSTLSDRASFVYDKPLCSWSALFTRFLQKSSESPYLYVDMNRNYNFIQN
jgi:hypothetical protein